MARVTYPEAQITDPVWAAGGIPHTALIPGGAKLEFEEWKTWWEGLKAKPEYGISATNPRIQIPASLMVERAFADRDAEPPKGFKPFAGGDPKTTEIYMIAFPIPDLMRNNDVELIIPSKTFLVYYNWLWMYEQRMKDNAAEIEFIMANFTAIKGVEPKVQGQP